MSSSRHQNPQRPSMAAASAASQNRQRQYAHLNAQLARLNAHLADMENLMRITALQAEYVRGLGGWMGGLFMASSKILGEEAGAGYGAARPVTPGGTGDRKSAAGDENADGEEGTVAEEGGQQQPLLQDGSRTPPSR